MTTIELSIRLSDGTFETKVIVPLECSAANRQTAVKRWLKLAREAMSLGVSNLAANFERDEARNDQD